MADLLSVVKTAAMMTDRILVAYSGGKDSVVTLDLCAKHFKHVDAFFMYQVPGLSFQERTLRWAERRYGVEIIRLPHWEVSHFLRWGTYADFDPDVRAVGIAELYAYLREKTGTYWIAAGERIADSTIRRAMIVKDGTINRTRGRVFPVAHWRKAHVEAYIARHQLKVSEEAKLLGSSFRDLSPQTLSLVKQHYPEDYKRVLQMYPLAEAGAKWQEFYGEGKAGPDAVPEV